MNQEILKEFDERFPYKLSEVINDFGSPVKNEIKQFISQAIAQTREETIREVEESLPKQKIEAYQNAEKEFMLIGFNDCISEVKTILNKLKK